MYLSRNFFQVGDEIKVVGGSLEGIRGVVISVDEDDGKLTIKRSDQEPVVVCCMTDHIYVHLVMFLQESTGEGRPEGLGFRSRLAIPRAARPVSAVYR